MLTFVFIVLLSYKTPNIKELTCLSTIVLLSNARIGGAIGALMPI
jgi:hypothetical protein